MSAVVILRYVRGMYSYMRCAVWDLYLSVVCHGLPPFATERYFELL